MKKITPHIYTWSVFNEEKQLNFNGHYIQVGAHVFLVDPPAMSESDIKEVEEFSIPTRIYLTNKHHTRDSARHRERWACQVFIHEDDKALMEIPVDGTFSDGELLEECVEVIRIPDAKTPGECAFFWKAQGVLTVGDALIGKPPGKLSLLSDDKFKDPQRFRQGLSVLRGLAYDILLVGDGESIFSGARPVVEGFLKEIQEGV